VVENPPHMHRSHFPTLEPSRCQSRSGFREPHSRPFDDTKSCLARRHAAANLSHHTTGDPLMRYYACFTFCGKTTVDPMDGILPVLRALGICIDASTCPVVARKGSTRGEACRHQNPRHC